MEDGVLPECIRPHIRHEFLRRGFGDALGGDGDAGIGEEDVQTTVLFQRLVDDAFDVVFVARVDFACVHVDTWVEGLDLALVGVEVCGGEVGDEDGAGAVVGELVRAGSADA